MPNVKALAQIHFEISCTQYFQILLSIEHNSEKGHKSDIRKNMGHILFMRNVLIEFQNASIHCFKFHHNVKKRKKSVKI